MVAQSCGAVVGAALLRGLIAESHRGAAGLGATGLGSDVTYAQVGQHLGTLGGGPREGLEVK